MNWNEAGKGEGLGRRKDEKGRTEKETGRSSTYPVMNEE